MNLVQRSIAVAVLSFALPIAVGSAAHAETWSRTDSAGDVLALSSDVDGAGQRDPHNRTADIRRVSVRHAARTVIITLRVRDLRGGDSMLLGAVATPDERYDLMVMRGSDFRMFMLEPSSSEPDGAGSTCRGKRLEHATAQDRIRITIPRSCLGDPAWVRVGATYLTGPLLSSVDGEGEAYADDAMSTGNRLGSIERPKLSPKVRVG